MATAVGSDKWHMTADSKNMDAYVTVISRCFYSNFDIKCNNFACTETQNIYNDPTFIPETLGESELQ